MSGLNGQMGRPGGQSRLQAVVHDGYQRQGQLS